MIEEKIKLIDEIVKRHPSAGVEKGWSWYTGGMVDNGDWHFRKMLDVPLEELQAFLNQRIEEENRPEIPLTEEEIRLSKEVHYIHNGLINGLELKRRKDFHDSFERKMFGYDRTR